MSQKKSLIINPSRLVFINVHIASKYFWLKMKYTFNGYTSDPYNTVFPQNHKAILVKIGQNHRHTWKGICVESSHVLVETLYFEDLCALKFLTTS